jgi:ribosomal protein S18 acetylase RimI-like enzyme
MPATHDPSGQVAFRPLSVDDTDIIADIAASAFGPSAHRASEIGRYLTVHPNYWLLATFCGQPAGVVGATDYGPFAYLGMMTVRKEFQGRGIGGRLLRQELRWLDELGVSFLRLDATDEGYPIYRRNGFDVLDRAVVLRLPKRSPFPQSPADVRVLEAAALEELVAFDTPVFGASRAMLLRALLEDFPGRAFCSHDASGDMNGFLVAQYTRLGPWVARDPESADSLLQAALALPFDGLPVAVAPGRNRAAFELLERYGFVRERESRHMQRGTLASPDDRTSIYGLTSFAVG